MAAVRRVVGGGVAATTIQDRAGASGVQAAGVARERLGNHHVCIARTSRERPPSTHRGAFALSKSVSLHPGGPSGTPRRIIMFEAPPPPAPWGRRRNHCHHRHHATTPSSTLSPATPLPSPPRRPTRPRPSCIPTVRIGWGGGWGVTLHHLAAELCMARQVAGRRLSSLAGARPRGPCQLTSSASVAHPSSPPHSPLSFRPFLALACLAWQLPQASQTVPHSGAIRAGQIW